MEPANESPAMGDVGVNSMPILFPPTKICWTPGMQGLKQAEG